MLDLHISPPLNIFYIFLGSLVLFKDSKTMVRFFGWRNFELFQCSAEGWGGGGVGGQQLKVPVPSNSNFPY